MTTKITIWTILLLSPISIFAEIQIPFWEEAFNAGIPGTWETVDELGDVTWEYCSDYDECPPVAGDVFELFSVFNDYEFASNSRDDGYAFIAPALQGGTNEAHRSYILTDLIDCSGQSTVYLQFNTLIIAGTSVPEDDAVVQVKAGSGAWTTFTVFKNMNLDLLNPGSFGLQSYNPQTVWLDLSSVAANETEVQIRWVWEWTGSEVFFWGIDDVELLDEDPNGEEALWGNLPGEGDFDGSLGDWTVLSQGQCGWVWDATGLVDTPDTNEEAEFYNSSPSVENGVALVNASPCVFNQPPNTTSQLISPNIDLMAVIPGQPLALKFHQTGALGNPTVEGGKLTKILVSVDGGSSFVDTINLNEDKVFIGGFSELIEIPLPLETAGSGQVQIRFYFSGEFIFWAIDDVKIVVRKENDLALSQTSFAVAPNFSTPLRAELPLEFVAEVKNIGASPQENVQLYAGVFADEIGELVFLDSILVGNLDVDEVREDVVFDNTYLPNSEFTNYTIRYWTEADTPDDDENNNTVEQKFELSKTLFSKNRGPKSIIRAGFAPSSTLDYETGNCFFIPPGSGLKATHISFSFRGNPNMQGINLLTQLYKWKTDNTFADANGDSLANVGEFIPVSYNEYFVNGDETLGEVLKVPISIDDESIALEDSTYYFATVGFESEPNNPMVFPIAACEDIDYTTMFYQSLLSGKPQYVSVLKLGGEDFFRVNSWGLKRIPFVQLHVKEPLTKVVEQNENAINFSVFPNPASRLLNIESHFEYSGENINYEIFDVFGRSEYSSELLGGNVSQTAIPIGELSNGIYFIRVSSGERSGSQMFFVQHDR